MTIQSDKRAEEIEVIVRGDVSLKNDIGRIQQIELVNNQGYFIPLSNFANISYGTEQTTINRIDGHYAVSISIEPNKNIVDSRGVKSLVRQWWTEHKSVYPQCQLELGKSEQEQAEAWKKLGFYFLWALVAIWFMTFWMLGSAFQPLVVILSIPYE